MPTGPGLHATHLPATAQVSPIVEKVRAEGDKAVKEFTAKFDRVELTSVCVRIEVRGACWGWAGRETAATRMDRMDRMWRAAPQTLECPP